jgi:glycosyltransferase involved in cell wall biosynthesis
LRLCHINLSKELRGGEIQMLALIECFADRYEQSVIVRREGLLHRRLIDLSSPDVAIIPVSNSIPSAVRAAENVDLLHVHEGRSVQVGAWRSLRGVPFVVTRRVLRRPKPNWPTRWIYSRASAIVCVSEAVATVIRDYLGDYNVETILDFAPKLAVDTQRVAELRQRYAGKLVVGHAGELDDRHKGQGIILQAARMAQADYPHLHFLLLGSGCDAAKLRAEARDMPNVEFMGRVENVGDYYSAMDLFVFPSREEALGSAILEAMSCGVPVIGSRVGGIPEVIHPGENGLLFESGDAGELFRCIVALASDSELRAKLAAQARVSAQSRSVEVVARQYGAIYQRVLAA